MKFEIHISTKNRLADLSLTLTEIRTIIDRSDVECIVYDDGSTDGTSGFIAEKYPAVKLLRNEISKGYMYCRNRMLNESTAEYAISLDDDAHFLSQNPLEIIDNYFTNNTKCGLIAFRIFWGKSAPAQMTTDERPEQVKGYVGCGHAWRISAWKTIPAYPEWFKFYGEETYASLHLFRQNIEVHYVPDIFVLHRVDLKARKSNADYKLRYLNSLKADWFLYFIFYPWNVIPRKLAYSFWMQIKKIFRGNAQLTGPLLMAVLNLAIQVPRLAKERHSLTHEQYNRFFRLNPVKIYWKP